MSISESNAALIIAPESSLTIPEAVDLLEKFIKYHGPDDVRPFRAIKLLFSKFISESNFDDDCTWAEVMEVHLVVLESFDFESLNYTSLFRRVLNGCISLSVAINTPSTFNFYRTNSVNVVESSEITNRLTATNKLLIGTFIRVVSTLWLCYDQLSSLNRTNLEAKRAMRISIFTLAELDAGMAEWFKQLLIHGMRDDVSSEIDGNTVTIVERTFTTSAEEVIEAVNNAETGSEIRFRVISEAISDPLFGLSEADTNDNLAELYRQLRGDE
jgi:hypothetical protein